MFTGFLIYSMNFLILIILFKFPNLFMINFGFLTGSNVSNTFICVQNLNSIEKIHNFIKIDFLDQFSQNSITLKYHILSY